MINAERLLGALVRQGLGSSRRRRKAGFGAGSLLGGGIKSAVGLGLVGVAIAAFDHFTEKSQGAASGRGAFPGSRSAGPPATPPPPPPGPPREPSQPQATDQRATLMIRGMIAAANCDGTIDQQERETILRRLEEGGLSAEERDWVRRELEAPPSLDTLLAQVDSPELARELYLVSLLAIDVDTDAERHYLDYIQKRLGLDESVAGEIQTQLSESIPPTSPSASKEGDPE